MVREPVIRTSAEAVGMVALNAATCAGMVIRRRSASSVPARVAGRLLEKTGIGLSGEGEGGTPQNRQSRLGALSGYVVGLGVGADYGLNRSSLGGGSRLRAGIVTGFAAMAGSDTPATALGARDPGGWSPQQLVSGTVPHLRPTRRLPVSLLSAYSEERTLFRG